MAAQEGGVFALLNVMGTESALAAKAFVEEKRLLLFGSTSGAEELEPPTPETYVFNVRVRYSDEAQALSRHLIKSADARIPPGNIAIFTQGSGATSEPDPVGAGAVLGVGRAVRLEDVPEDRVKVATYQAGTISVEPGRKALLEWMADPERAQPFATSEPVHLAVVVAAAADAAALLVKRVSDSLTAARKSTVGLSLSAEERDLLGEMSLEQTRRLAAVEARFAALSVAGVALFERLRGYGTFETPEFGAPVGVTALVRQRYGAETLLSLPVPDAQSDHADVVRFRDDLQAYEDELGGDQAPDEATKATWRGPVAMEAYLNAALLGEALTLHGPDLTTESLIGTLERLHVDLFGMTLAFARQSHQASNRTFVYQVREGFTIEQVLVLEVPRRGEN